MSVIAGAVIKFGAKGRSAVGTAHGLARHFLIFDTNYSNYGEILR